MSKISALATKTVRQHSKTNKNMALQRWMDVNHCNLEFLPEFGLAEFDPFIR